MYILVIYTVSLCLFINYNTYKYINLLTIRKAEREKKKITNNEYLCMSNITFYFYFLVKYKKNSLNPYITTLSVYKCLRYEYI